MNIPTLNRNRTRNRLTGQLAADLNLTPLKVTALAYLSEARNQEQYEQMTEIVRYAREFGATNQEIRAVLTA